MTDAQRIQKIEDLCHEYALSTIPERSTRILHAIKRNASYLAPKGYTLDGRKD